MSPALSPHDTSHAPEPVTGPPLRAPVSLRRAGRLALALFAVAVASTGRADETAPPPDPGIAGWTLAVDDTLPPPVAATVARVTSGHAFVTDDGHEIHLSGIAAPHTHGDEPVAGSEVDPAVTAAKTLADLLTRQPVWLYPVTRQPDRHGRIRARVVRAGDGDWIEAKLVAAGLARVEPHSDDFGCSRHLEALEAEARAAGIGLWADPRFAVLSATDPDLGRWVGRYVLIEGTVVSTGVSGTRRYLNFGKDFRRDFAVILDDKSTVSARKNAPRRVGRFAADGFESADIVGKLVRIRGILTLGGGGLMVPSVPEEIEWVKGQP